MLSTLSAIAKAVSATKGVVSLSTEALRSALKSASSLLMPVWMKPLEWFWLGQNLHSIHHLFPRVPFYRYHALHRRIEPIMRAHGTPILGVFSRRDA